MALRQRFEPLRRDHWPAMADMISNTIDDASPAAQSLRTMCGYHFDTGGKRLRAILPLLVAEALGEDPATVRPFGAACEMLHNATLVHDDLQDGDTTRRSCETVWKRFGVPQAINLGDAMFYYAVLLAQDPAFPPERRDRVVHRLLVETLRVIDGQESEFALKGKPQVGLDDYFRMVEGKTSGLFALPMSGAAELCGADTAIVNGLSEAAGHLGVLFQIQDDILDLYGSKGREQRGSDIAEGKRSVLVVYALEKAEAVDRERLRAILDAPRERTSAADIDVVVELFERVGALDFAIDEMLRRRELAKNAPGLASRETLVHLVDELCDVLWAPIKSIVEQRGNGETHEIAARVNTQAPVATDAAFCEAMLPKVSRTFALSIEQLPVELRDTVRTAYLLCRLVDTIEDDAKLQPADRENLFDLFGEVLTDDARSWAGLESAARRHDLGEDAEAELALGSGTVLRVFRALPAAQRRVVRRRILEMQGGMRTYCKRADIAGRLRISDLEDLECYCYFVAGTVGKLLTDLFVLAVPNLDVAKRQVAADCAVSFGLGLQMVNIVKDVAEDLERGVCYLPEILAAGQGIRLEQILEPAHRDKGLEIIARVCERACSHLERAKTYTLAWPSGGVGEQVRLFCAVPLVLALATLAEVQKSGDTLVPGATPKLDRKAVADLLMRVQEAVKDDAALTALLDDVGV